MRVVFKLKNGLIKEYQNLSMLECDSSYMYIGFFVESGFHFCLDLKDVLEYKVFI